MIQSTSVAPDLGLRPIPGPDPVDLPTSDWWMYLIPLVLIGFLWYWWFRRPVKRQLTGHDRLLHALEEAGNTSTDARQRYQTLHQALRECLAEFDPGWKTLTADDSLPRWQKLFPEQAQKWHTHWIAAEAIIFGPDTVEENQVADYARLINELDLELSSENEKELKSTDLGQNRNKS
jgi:hypothetical protein